MNSNNLNPFIFILSNCMLKHMGKNNPKYLENKEIIQKLETKKQKYDFFLKTQSDIVLNKCFIKAQKAYLAFLKFINKILFKKSIKYNVEDLLGNTLDLKNPRLFKVRIDRIVYTFTYNEFIQIVNTSLFNYQEPLSEIDEFICLEYILIKPLDIKNPYTNVIFNHTVLLNFYHFCMFNYINIPIVYKIFYLCNFNIKQFFLENELLVYKYTVKSFIKNLNNVNKKKILIEAIDVLCDFILKYFRNSILKLICVKYKERINAININLLDDYKKILVDFYLMNYFLHNKQYKIFLQYKLKLILELLNNNTIKFIPNNIETSNFSIEKIVDKITSNMEFIVNEELKSIFVSTNLNMLMNSNINSNENNNNDNNEDDNGVENNEDISSNQNFNIDYNLSDMSNNLHSNIHLIMNNNEEFHENYEQNNEANDESEDIHEKESENSESIDEDENEDEDEDEDEDEGEDDDDETVVFIDIIDNIKPNEETEYNEEDDENEDKVNNINDDEDNNKENEYRESSKNNREDILDYDEINKYYKNINLNNKNKSEENEFGKAYRLIVNYIDNYCNSFLFKITFMNIHIFVNFNIFFFIYTSIVSELNKEVILDM